MGYKCLALRASGNYGNMGVLVWKRGYIDLKKSGKLDKSKSSFFVF